MCFQTVTKNPKINTRKRIRDGVKDHWSKYITKSMLILRNTGIGIFISFVKTLGANPRPLQRQKLVQFA